MTERERERSVDKAPDWSYESSRWNDKSRSAYQRFKYVLTTLDDAVNDAPRAAEFLGRIFAIIIMENVISFSEVGRLIYEGGEEKGCLVEMGLAAEVLGSILETIKSEMGDSVLTRILSSSNLLLENFRPPGSNKSWRLDKFT
ncbi:unnamed protein product [Fraxinus pennsylvanica]|uniref:Uncharacterized protein n=1 Tax=Fraxinus pennsylvanica TaxID=56036 RepID=A0AAD2AF13_9LAMI|nr:unnamed protein product [Fraxinus pennsylvanica]